MAAPDQFLDSSAFRPQVPAVQAGRSQLQSTIFDEFIPPETVEWYASFSSPADSKIESLFRLIPIQAPYLVRAFLRRHPTLVPVLMDSAVKIREYWGINTKFELRLVNDPEEPEEDAASLVVYIDSASQDAYSILDRFDEEWWLQRLPEAHGRLNFLV